MPARVSKPAWLGLFTAFNQWEAYLVTQMIMAAAEATDCSKSQLISLSQMHERSRITTSARSVTRSF